MRKRRFGQRESGNGFALVICLLLMVLIAILAVGLSGLAAIELRRSTQGEHAAIAKANARLALVQAIGQLQRTLGPDQRVSATAEILPGNPKQPHWTGAWRTTQNDGKSFFKRDDLAGGLSDERSTLGIPPADRVMEWLVSGSGNPLAGAGADPVVLAREEGGGRLEVPKVVQKNARGQISGHHAWWTGDLGVRANVGTRDPRQDQTLSRGNPGGEAWFRLMASQAADASIMTGGTAFTDAEIRKLASADTTSLTAAGEAWSRKHAFDFTVDSRGVLADVARGGLKHDLTAFFAGNGDIPAWKNLPGLTKNSPLVGDPDVSNNPASRYAKAGPRFGLLRDWARLAVPFSGRNVASRLPETDPAAGRNSEKLALANEAPVKLAGNTTSSLQPILVEATNFTQWSTFLHAVTTKKIYQLRQLMYPRVVLWNPYNVELKFEPAIIMIQGNGRQEMWTGNENVNKTSNFRKETDWLSFEGGRSTSFFGPMGIMSSEGYNDPYMGSYYFSIPRTTFQPGECLVFSPAKAAEYDGLSVYRPGPYNLNKNVLSCEVAPDPSRAYYVSGSDIGGGIDFMPTQFWYAPTNWVNVPYQSDDTRAVLKSVGNTSTVTFDTFDSLPQIAVLSASLQYGAGREPRFSWSKYERMPMELLDRNNPRPTVIPNVRTREGIRLRWFDEHPSNQLHSGKLLGTAHFEDALLANWNPRASFILRSPWENIAGNGEPWFFGAYTRDLFDQAVSWDEQAPVLSGGRYHGNPFGPPQEGSGRYVLFDVPRSETGVVSLGQLQHVKLSEFIWHPSYAIGNSLADPRLGTGSDQGLHRTAAPAINATVAKAGGFHENQIGWSSDTMRAKSRTEWAANARAILGEVPATDNLVYDLSFEANHNLWDRYFLSTGTSAEKQRFIDDPFANPLPNSRMRLFRASTKAEQLDDFHQSAAALMVEGAFNVNSTRVEAWKALLASSRLSGYGSDGNTPFPRVLDAPDGGWKNGDSASNDKVWSGYRELTPDEIHQLAVAITNEVKLRGPFISLADFVNRRLAQDETGRMGALQAAIEKAGLNSSLAAEYPLDNQKPLPDYRHPDNITDATRLEQTLKPASKAWGAPSWLTQADVLQALGPVLSARSDSFVIRSYGDSVDASGKVAARAWCEAVVQRTPEPIDPDDSGLNPKLNGANGDFGRRFVITSFRWLSPQEI
jgi:type II secretory pathway pseudopilin PulG